MNRTVTAMPLDRIEGEENRSVHGDVAATDPVQPQCPAVLIRGAAQHGPALPANRDLLAGCDVTLLLVHRVQSGNGEARAPAVRRLRKAARKPRDTAAP